MEPFKSRVLAIAEVIIPPLEKNVKLKSRFWDNFSCFYNDLDADSAGKLAILSNVLDKLSMLYNFKSLNSLNSSKREKFLNKMTQFPVKKIVAGFTGLRNLIIVSYYSMNDTWEELNYDGPLVNRSIN